jgi:hypothetical protein
MDIDNHTFGLLPSGDPIINNHMSGLLLRGDLNINKYIIDCSMETSTSITA